jgi:hypothetical protein
MRFISATSFAALLALGASQPLVAEQLQMPAEDTMAAPGEASMAMPVKGMPMDQVRQMYGEPNEIRGPVGDPPITRWVYDRYTVYFEHSHVIHSVLNR